jgi:hypothetical protein
MSENLEVFVIRGTRMLITAENLEVFVIRGTRMLITVFANTTLPVFVSSASERDMNSLKIPKGLSEAVNINKHLSVGTRGGGGGVPGARPP